MRYYVGLLLKDNLSFHFFVVYGEKNNNTYFDLGESDFGDKRLFNFIGINSKIVRVFDLMGSIDSTHAFSLKCEKTLKSMRPDFMNVFYVIFSLVCLFTYYS